MTTKADKPKKERYTYAFALGYFITVHECSEEEARAKGWTIQTKVKDKPENKNRIWFEEPILLVKPDPIK